MAQRDRDRLRVWLGLLGWLASMWLAACGQRGPLVLPDGAPAASPSSIGEEDNDDAEDDSER